MPLDAPPCLQNLRRFFLLVCCGWILVTAPTNLQAQDADEVTLAQLQEQWRTLDTQLGATEELLKTGEGDLESIKKEFDALLVQANDLIKKIEAKAKSNLETKPNDSASLRALLGIMLNDAQNGRDAKVLMLGDDLIAQGINPRYFEIAARSDRLSIAAREIFDELIIRQAEALANDLPRVKLKTTQGDIVLELFENEAPGTVGNFISLVESGYYTDRIFHRVLEGFMAQGGGFKLDEDGAEIGREGPGYTIKCECYTPDRRQHFTGSISMAHRGKDTGASQFFLTFRRTSGLDSSFPADPRRAAHTCFGRVIDGFDVLDNLTRTHIDRSTPMKMNEEPIPGITKDKIISAEVIRKRDHEYRPDKVGEDEDGAAKSKPTTELSAPETETGESDGQANNDNGESEKGN